MLIHVTRKNRWDKTKLIISKLLFIKKVLKLKLSHITRNFNLK